MNKLRLRQRLKWKSRSLMRREDWAGIYGRQWNGKDVQRPDSDSSGLKIVAVVVMIAIVAMLMAR